MLSVLVELPPGGSLHHSETVEHEAEVPKVRLEVFSRASVAHWEDADWRELVGPFQLASLLTPTVDLRD